MNLNRLLAYFFLASILALNLSNIQTAEAVSLSPLTFELIANPGETVTNVLKVTNTDAFPVGVVIEVNDFRAIGEEGQVTLEDPSEDLTYSLARWVTTEPNSFSLDPGEVKSVQFTINVPINAEPGGHYSSVLASIRATGANTGGVSVAQKVGSLLLMNIAGEVREDLRIVELKAPSFSEYGPVDIVARFENNGSVHVKPRGFILIENIFGREVGKLDLPQKNVLPRSIRRVEVPWGDRYMFGKYRATLTAIYGTTNNPISAVTTFWVIPWKIAGAILLGLLILLAILIRGRKRFGLAIKILLRGAKTS